MESMTSSRNGKPKNSFKMRENCCVCGTIKKLAKTHHAEAQNLKLDQWRSQCTSVVCDVLQLNAINSCYKHLLSNKAICHGCLNAFREIEMSMLVIQRGEERLCKLVKDVKIAFFNHSRRSNKETKYAEIDIDQLEQGSSTDLDDWSTSLSTGAFCNLILQSNYNWTYMIANECNVKSI